jgi:hypothetical protein
VSRFVIPFILSCPRCGLYPWGFNRYGLDAPEAIPSRVQKRNILAYGRKRGVEKMDSRQRWVAAKFFVGKYNMLV